MWKRSRAVVGSESLELKGEYTFVARGAKIQGHANLKGVVRIDGEFQGNIYSHDTLIVGEHGVVRGTITAEEIICSGKIQATLMVKRKVQLLTPAVLIGEVSTPVFIMEPGALFQGWCDMGLKQSAPRMMDLSQESGTRSIESLPQVPV